MAVLPAAAFIASASPASTAPVTATVSLNAGDNTIRLDPTTSAGLPNIDYLDTNG